MSTRLQLAQSIAQSPAKASLEDLRRLCERAGCAGGDADERARRGHKPSGDGVLMTGWTEIDQVLPSRGLDTARLHEWVGVMPSVDRAGDAVAGDRSTSTSGGAKRGTARQWTPALSVLSHLVGRVVHQAPHRQVLWIGERVWPCPLSMDEAVLRRSVFVRATKWFERLWAADLALRSGAAGAVIVDAGGMDLSATRRLQLAAESGGKGGGGGGGDGQGGRGGGGGGGALCLIARPPWELSQLTASTTRWCVSRVAASLSVGFAHPARRWSVELLRCKGVQPEMAAPRRWILEHDHASHGLVVARVLDGSGESAAEPSRRRASG
jgi:hypothetical protein